MQKRHEENPLPRAVTPPLPQISSQSSVLISGPPETAAELGWGMGFDRGRVAFSLGRLAMYVANVFEFENCSKWLRSLIDTVVAVDGVAYSLGH